MITVSEHESYMIDTARERVYQNQDELYHNIFTQWRNDPQNPYGYRFIHDSREHTYIDGEGFACKLCASEEKRAMHNCLSLLGKIMLVYFALRQIIYLLMKVLFGEVHAASIYFSERASNTTVTSEEIILFCAAQITMLIITVFLCAYNLKLPPKIALPCRHVERHILISCFSVSMLLMVSYRLFDYLLKEIFYRIGIDSTYYAYIQTDTDAAQSFFFLSQMLIVPVLYEIICRGYILQTFRQFGDIFAIIIAALTSALCYCDITHILYVFALGVALGMVTIRCGNVVPSCVIRVTVVNLTCLLNTLSVDNHNMPDRMLELLICLGILLFSTIVLVIMQSKNKSDFRIEADSTELDLNQKLKQILNSTSFMIWVICTLFATILSVNFI